MNEKSSSSSDELDFLQVMQDVKPLQHDNLCPPKPRPCPSKSLKRQAAEGTDPKQMLSLEIPYWARLSPDDWPEYAKPGMQHGVLKKLRLGHYDIQARLDLQGQPSSKVQLLLPDFIEHQFLIDHRCILVVTGKGQLSQPPARLKSLVAFWLPQLPQVLAFHPAQPRHGGNAAFYVLLKKNPEAKKDNWEQQIKRRV